MGVVSESVDSAGWRPVLSVHGALPGGNADNLPQVVKIASALLKKTYDFKLGHPLGPVKRLEHSGFAQHLFHVGDGCLPAMWVLTPDDIEADIEEKGSKLVMCRRFGIERRGGVIQ